MEEFLSQKKNLVTVLGILLLLFAIPLTIWQAQQQQEVRSRAAGDVAFSFSPSSAQKAVDETFEVQVTLSGGTFDISGVDITLSFTPQYLELLSFTPSTYSTIIRNAVSNTSGTLRLTALNVTTTPITGNILLGTATFKTKAEGTTSIGISTAQVTASGQQNALQTDISQAGSYTIVPSSLPTETLPPTQPSVTPTSIPLPTETPTPLPTNVPTLIPTNTPVPPTEPVAAPTTTIPPTATPIAVATPTFIPTPTPDPNSAQLVINDLTLTGIASNIALSSPQKAITLDIVDNNGGQIGSPVRGTITYNSEQGKFNGFLNIGAMNPGNYIFKIKLDKYLRRQMPGFTQITSNNQSITLPALELALVAGDITNDNRIDIQDYNMLINCFLNKADTGSCSGNKNNADLNENGVVDEFDYNVLIRSFSSVSGD